MNYFKLWVSILMVSFISGCTSPANNTNGAVNEPTVDYDERKNTDTDRETVLTESKERKAGAICEDEDNKHNCKELCKEMYRRIGDRDDCEELTVTQIEVLHDIFELLEDPDIDDLDAIEALDFDVYLNVSISSLDNLVDDWSKSETQEFLSWLIKNEDVAKVFIKEDNDDYNTFSAMLKNLTSFTASNDTIHKPFVAKVEDEKLMEEAIDSGHEEVREWFMDYINDKHSACKSDEVSKACFKVYCLIGKGIKDDYMEDWSRFDDFQSYLEDIIKGKINATNGAGSDTGTGWTYGDGENQFEDFGNISSDWVDDLCGGI